MTNPEMRYFSDEANPPFPLELVIAPSGSAILTIGTNRGNVDQGSVGVFKKNLEDREIAGLVAALRSSDFMSIQNPDSALPGEPVHRLSITEKGCATVIRWIGFHTPAPPAFLTIEKQAIALVKLVRQNPFQALAMQVSSLPKQLERDKTVEFSITIINPGSEIIKVPHPERWAEDAGQVQLIGLRSDIALEVLEEYHQKFEELSADQIQNIEELKLTKPLISLAPNERLMLVFQVKLDWPPGRYDSKVALTSHLIDQEEKQIDFELISITSTVNIFGPSKPGDEPDDLDEEGNDDFEEEDLE